jgi:hypothetical protein
MLSIMEASSGVSWCCRLEGGPEDPPELGGAQRRLGSIEVASLPNFLGCYPCVSWSPWVSCPVAVIIRFLLQESF